MLASAHFPGRFVFWNHISYAFFSNTWESLLLCISDMFLSENPKNGFIFVFLMCFDDISRRWYELAKPSVEESSSTGDYFNDAGQGEEEEKIFCIFVFFRQHVVTAGHCIKNKQLNNINVTLGEVYYTIMMMIFAMICFEQWENGLELDFANLCTSTTLGRSWRLIQAGHTRWDSCWIVDGDPSSSSETKEKKTHITRCWVFGCLIVVCRPRWPRWLSTPTSSSAQQQTGSRPDI